MDLNKTIKELSLIERKALLALTDEKEKSIEEIAKNSDMVVDSARRAVGWLAEKNLVSLNNVSIKGFVLTKQGKDAVKKGLPERRMLSALKAFNGKASFSDIVEKAKLSEEEFNVALGQNKRNAFISVMKDTKGMYIELTEVANDLMNNELEAEIIIKKIGKEEISKEDAQNLIKRKLIVFQERIDSRIKINENGKMSIPLIKELKDERVFNLSSGVEKIYIGKKQPYIQFLNIIRRKLTELGFKEMHSPLVVQEFYNFDVLFQPQNHPARTWTDTYRLLNPEKGKLPDKKKVKSIKDAHEHGGISASSGWGYSWLDSIAERLMPAAHGTAHSARQLIKGVESPGKYFAISRCFRPDVMDATHLIEFNQTEGFIVGEDLNFRQLLGTLKNFAEEIGGATKVKFYPDYYPFTEPSVQLSAKHPDLGWIELGGAGMFRPEILENLGIKGQAIAWGLGIDRLAMLKLGIKDIRFLFSDDLGWLRNSKMVKE